MRDRPLIGAVAAGLLVAALGIAGGGRAPSARHGGPVAAPDGGARPDAVATPLAALERAVAAAPRVAARATVTIGHSAEGRAIRAVATNGQGDGPLILVFGCIHGTECAGMRIARRVYAGCPPAGDGTVVVPDLDPDGLALGTRLNARGVDLNRNFAAGWRPIGVAGDPEHSGPRPFSEPETRVARRLIRALRPEVTIWYHQQAEPLVRAWGPSVAAARRYARLAGTRFARMRWLHGTAPNWQNHRFPGTSSFVVELASQLEGSAPPDPPGQAEPGTYRRHAAAIGALGAGR